MIKIITIIWAITIPPLMWTIILPVATCFCFKKCHGFTEKVFVYIILFLKRPATSKLTKTWHKNPLIKHKKPRHPPQQSKHSNQPKPPPPPPQKKNLFVSPAKSGVLDNNSLSSFRVERKARGPTGHKLDIPLKPGDPAEPSTVGSWLSPKKNAPDSACRFGKFEENKIYIYIYIYMGWVWPPPNNSDHQDSYIFSGESP